MGKLISKGAKGMQIQTEQYIKIEDIKFKPMGREYIENKGKDDACVILEMASRGIVFNANFMGDLQLDVSAREIEHKYFTVVIDGVENNEFKIALSKPNNRELITVAKDIEPGNHTIEIYTQTENGPISIYGVKICGKILEKPKNKDLYIEFIGDSITSGCANLVSVQSVAGLRHGNAYMAYGSQTARLLNADWCNVAISGGTLVNSNGERAHMPTEYLKTTTCKKEFFDFKKARKPDIVVINLGTNDNGFIKNRPDKEYYIKVLIEEFAKTVIEKYSKQVKIVFAFGMMTGSVHYINDCYIEVAKKLMAEGYNAWFCLLPQNQEGGAGHPNVEGHTAASKVLSNFISDNVLK